MKWIAAVLLCLLSTICVGQTHVFGALDTNNPWTGQNSFSNTFSLTALANGCLQVSSGVVISTGSSCAAAGTVTSVTFTGDGTVLSSIPSAPVTVSGTLPATLNAQTHDTVFGNFTGNTASPLFNAINGGSSCGDGTHALSYTNGTGFGCQTLSTGSVSSVGLTVNSTSPSGIFTVTGSPVTVSGSLNINLAGFSGGVPYFSSSSVLASSNLLTANNPVIGGGAGLAPSSGARSGNTTTFGTTSGSLTSGHCADFDASGNIADAGAACGTGTGTVTTTGSPAAHQPAIFSGSASITGVSAGVADAIFMGNDAGATSDPAFKSGPGSCSGASSAVTYNTSTHVWGCNSIIPGTGTVTSVTFTGDGVVDSSTPSTAVTTSGTVTATLKAQTHDTVFGNVSGSTASPSFTAAPAGGTNGCSGTTDVTIYTAGTGWGCHQITGTGTVTSVGLTVNSTSPSGIFTVTGSPVTGSGTLNFNLAGNSGGIPYFSSSTVLSSSSLLTAHGVVTGGGSATSPGSTSAGAADTIFMGNDAGTGSDPAFKAGPSGGTNGCAGTTDTPTYNTSTHAWGCHQITGAAVYTLQVNGSGLAAGDTVNLNATTPAAPANGVNVTFATSKASTTDSISAAIIGDTTATHYLSGVGTWTTPPGTYTLPTQYAKLRCETGLGDGLNAIAAGTYLQSMCYNDSGVTWTITGIKCYTDTGTSTLNAAGNTLGALLTGAVTCTSSWATASQSANIALTSGDYIKFTFVADGNATQTTWLVSMTQ